jgi:hypothetical protein
MERNDENENHVWLSKYQMNNALVSDPGQSPERDGGEVADARRGRNLEQPSVADVASPAASWTPRTGGEG